MVKTNSWKVWIVLGLAALLFGMLIFGSFLWFLTAHLGQIFGIALALAVAWIIKEAQKNGGRVDKNTMVLVVIMIAVALVLLFVPLNFISALREASIATITRGG